MLCYSTTEKILHGLQWNLQKMIPYVQFIKRAVVYDIFFAKCDNMVQKSL